MLETGELELIFCHSQDGEVVGLRTGGVKLLLSDHTEAVTTSLYLADEMF